MPFETSKSVMRRNFDRRFATTYFVGKGIDVGCGPDPISRYTEMFPLMTTVRSWDQHDGDGQLLEGIEDESLDFVHSSHSLEHMQDPRIALRNWIRVVKPGGHIIIMLPDEDLFEQGKWPSTFSGPDHVTAWTIGKAKSWCPASINVIDFVKEFADVVEPLKIELLNSTFLYSMPFMDQTRSPIGECAIEVILRKRTADEISKMGRLPTEEVFVYNGGQ